MDFNSPLATGNSRKDAAKDPHRRLHRFEKEFGQLLQTWRNSSNLIHDIGAADTIELRIHELADMLLDEARRPLPHSCLAFAAERQIFVPIAKIATSSYNLCIVKEAVYFFGALVESEDDVFVETRTFASSLTTLLVRITSASSVQLDVETETKIVELAFNITTKLRLRPEILPAWFRASRRVGEKGGEKEKGGLKGGEVDDDDDKHLEKAPRREAHERFKGKTQRQDFPLFYILMDYIHSEGKLGDFARTGLLYIIEAASTAVTLEQWIVESDLSTLMATGLGALYSQLSRKLVIDHPPADLPPVLALSDYEHPPATFEIVSSCSPDFQVQLDTFLSHLLFWQDVLNHCRSLDVKSTLLEHFQVIFLQQLLYPSLLESSDIDGGSSVAVLTYLRRILESLDHPDMINLILHYLLALPDIANPPPTAAQNAVTAARKRKSMDLATMMAQKADVSSATPLLFNLVDLILACLKSYSQQTIHVTLQLVSVILRRHHRYAVMTLLRTAPTLGSASDVRTIGAHQQDLEFFMATAGLIGGQDNFDEIYDNILHDTVVRLESHPCSLKLIAPKVSTNNHELPAIPDSLPGAPKDVSHHTIRTDDPLLAAVLDRLETFLVNPVDTNLSITEALLDMATCGFVSLEGWLLRHPDNYVFDEDEDADEAREGGISGDGGEPENALESDDMLVERRRTAAMRRCRRRPRWAGLPRMITVLQTLVDQVAAYRQTIPRFEDLLQQRREAFQTADSSGSSVSGPAQYYKGSHTATVATVAVAIPATPNTGGAEGAYSEGSRGASPVRPSGIEGFAQRILYELGTPSRSVTPRGRKDRSAVLTSTGGNGITTGLGFSTPASARPVTAVAPREFPMNINNTLVRGARSLSSGGRVGGGTDSEESAFWGQRQNGAVIGQLAAFQAVDRDILSRRMGLPVLPAPHESTVVPIPLHFDKAAMPTESESRSEGKDNEDRDGEEKDDEGTRYGNDIGDSDMDASLVESTLPSENGDALAALAALTIGEKTATVSHILTNTVILQSFLLEMAAVLQARAGLFDEVRFV